MDFRFIKNYQNDPVLRASFQELTRKIYRFDFEDWYQNGYWKENYQPYSAAIGDRIVANVSVNPMYFAVNGEKKCYVQIGTVMTDPQFRGKGLSRKLMEWVLDEWKEKCDMIFLFANDSVLDFYPKFGFVARKEAQAVKAYTPAPSPLTVRHMDLSDPQDARLLWETAQNTAAQGALTMLENGNLMMFYCKCFSRWDIGKHVYHLPELNAVAIATYDEDTMELYDVFAPQEASLDDVIAALAKPETRKIAPTFLPKDPTGWKITPYQSEDTTLFTLGKEGERFETEPLRFPELSHT